MLIKIECKHHLNALLISLYRINVNKITKPRFLVRANAEHHLSERTVTVECNVSLNLIVVLAAATIIATMGIILLSCYSNERQKAFSNKSVRRTVVLC